jgi:succinoglycan biosynthesis protein ExoM
MPGSMTSSVAPPPPDRLHKGTDMPSVAVCALTYHRPLGLRRLLVGLRTVAVHGDLCADVTVVIVDNDPKGSARPVVEECAARLPWPVVYVVEPQRGIPAGRNTAVRVAGDVEFVAFIDDDEIPSPRWLEELLEVQRDTGADVVTGPVVPRFEARPPSWAAGGDFFASPRFPTGSSMTWATTSNVLISSAVLAAADPPFHEGMTLSGGSDTHFFMRAHRQGRRMVWADEAVVMEYIPATRAKLRWLVRREFRRGITLSTCLRDLELTPWRAVRRIAHGAVRLLQGFGQMLLAVVVGRHQAVRGLGTMSFGAGLLAGLAGVSYQEYRVVHGR